jgi:polyether ionophore transport system permease protein
MAGPAASAHSARPPAVRTLGVRALRDARVRTVAFAYLFALYAYIQPVGFRHAYPSIADRVAFAHSFASNAALRLFYGYPYDATTVGGYCAWRVGGTLAIAAAAFGVLAAVRALRAEEDRGRTELILAGPVGRQTACLAAMAAVASGAAILALAELAGLLVGGLPGGGSALLAIATVSVVLVYAGVGALASEVAPTRRAALEAAGAVVVLSLLLRVIADTASGAGWLRWATPLGWAEELRPFSGAHPLVLLLPLAATFLLLTLAVRIARVRDIGNGIFPTRTGSRPRLRLLSSPTAHALRSERGSLLAWTGGVACFAAVLGMVSASVSSAGISRSIQREIEKLGAGSIATPVGYLSFVFLFFVLAVSLFACAQVSAAGQQEADGRLETLLSLPVGRGGWLGGRLLLATAAGCVLSQVAGLLTWTGATVEGVHVSLARMLEAGANCLPVVLLFLGIAALAYATVPRASALVSYALVVVSFLWQLVGSLLGAPQWLVDVTPFAHVGLVPTQPFHGGAAAVMALIGVAAAGAALLVFRRRDLIGL